MIRRFLLTLILGLSVYANGWAADFVIDEVRVQGNRRSEAAAVLRVVKTRGGTQLDRRQLSDDIKRVFKLGFYRDIKVDLSRIDGKRVITFMVVEKPSIRKIIYKGQEELTEDEITDVVDIRPFGVLDLAKVTRNAEKIKDLYIEKGYFLADIKWSSVSLPNNEVDIVFTIEEKSKVKVTEFSIIGNSVLSDSYIKERLETREDGPLGFMSGAGTYDKNAFDRDILRISQFYWDEGYVRHGSESRRLS